MCRPPFLTSPSARTCILPGSDHIMSWSRLPIHPALSVPSLCRARTRILALSWCIPRSLRCPRVLADQAVNDLSALDPGGHVDRLARLVQRRPLLLCVSRTSPTSCDQAIFVDQTTDASLSSDTVLTEIDRWVQRFQRRGAVQRAVRPVLIVVGFVLEQDPPQMALVPDEGAVQELAAAFPIQRSPDGVHAGRLDFAEHGPDPGIGEDRIENGRVVRAAVPDHELDPVRLLAEVHQTAAARGWRPFGITASRVASKCPVRRRHMIGDHHSQTAGSATLRVTAMDGILGAHRPGVSTLSVSGCRLRCRIRRWAAASRRASSVAVRDARQRWWRYGRGSRQRSSCRRGLGSVFADGPPSGGRQRASGG
jgi:hypothetical protein